jgi:hypothetical protein
MTIETILGQKGTDVATIEPEASVRKAADWLRVRNIGALVVTSGNAVLGTCNGGGKKEGEKARFDALSGTCSW